MIRKSGNRFPKRSCSNKKIERDDDSKKSHPALLRRLCRPRRKPDTVIGKIAFERARRARAVGERHIAVGPEQIERIAGETRLLIFAAPAEDVERHAVSRAPSGEFGAGRTINMHLP